MYIHLKIQTKKEDLFLLMHYLDEKQKKFMEMADKQKNVLGEDLEECSAEPTNWLV